MLIIEFENDITGDTDVAHYRYRVRLDLQLLVEGQIRNHHRDLGWQQLVRRLLRDEEERSIQNASLCLERIAKRLEASLDNEQLNPEQQHAEASRLDPTGSESSDRVNKHTVSTKTDSGKETASG